MKLKQMVCMVPENIHQQIKLISVEEKTTIQELVTEIFKNYLISKGKYNEDGMPDMQ